LGTRLRLFTALVSIAIAAACVLESARRSVPPVEPVHVAEPF
jgi:hypothetical protein